MNNGQAIQMSLYEIIRDKIGQLNANVIWGMDAFVSEEIDTGFEYRARIQLRNFNQFAASGKLTDEDLQRINSDKVTKAVEKYGNTFTSDSTFLVDDNVIITIREEDGQPAKVTNVKSTLVDNGELNITEFRVESFLVGGSYSTREFNGSTYDAVLPTLNRLYYGELMKIFDINNLNGHTFDVGPRFKLSEQDKSVLLRTYGRLETIVAALDAQCNDIEYNKKFTVSKAKVKNGEVIEANDGSVSTRQVMLNLLEADRAELKTELEGIQTAFARLRNHHVKSILASVFPNMAIQIQESIMTTTSRIGVYQENITVVSEAEVQETHVRLIDDILKSAVNSTELATTLKKMVARVYLEADAA